MKKLLFLLLANSVFFTINSMHSDDDQLSKKLIEHLEYDYDEDENLAASLLIKHSSYVPQGDNLHWVLQSLDNLDLMRRSVIFTELLNRTDKNEDKKCLYNVAWIFDKTLHDSYVCHDKAREFVITYYGKKYWKELLDESACQLDQG